MKVIKQSPAAFTLRAELAFCPQYGENPYFIYNLSEANKNE